MHKCTDTRRQHIVRASRLAAAGGTNATKPTGLIVSHDRYALTLIIRIAFKDNINKTHPFQSIVLHQLP